MRLTETIADGQVARQLNPPRTAAVLPTMRWCSLADGSRSMI
jgi:hypothetical protein